MSFIESFQVVNLFQKMVEKELDFRAVIGNDDVTNAVVAELLAKRYMKVDMQRLLAMFQKLSHILKVSEILPPMI